MSKGHRQIRATFTAQRKDIEILIKRTRNLTILGKLSTNLRVRLLEGEKPEGRHTGQDPRVGQQVGPGHLLSSLHHLYGWVQSKFICDSLNRIVWSGDRGWLTGQYKPPALRPLPLVGCTVHL
jgi:hypothetical protein